MEREAEMAQQRLKEQRPATRSSQEAKLASREKLAIAAPALAAPSSALPLSTPFAPADHPPLREQAWDFGKIPVSSCSRQEQDSLESKPDKLNEGGALPAVLQSALRDSGSPLDSATRQLMERRVGHDFGSVRVHSDAQAAASTRALDALAITSGSHILFGAGAYALDQPRGQGLLAHELVHVVQHQRFAASTNGRLLSQANDPAERQADALVQSVMAGGRVAAWSPTAPASILSLAPNTWYRGFAVGVPPVADGKVVHDMGGGVYFTDTHDAAQQYASLRSNGNQAAERVITGTVDPHSLGPVYDLREDPKFMGYFNHLRKTGPVSGERYRPLVESALAAKGKKIEDFAVIIGPEGVRGGTQMVIRNPQAAVRVVSGMTQVKGGGTPPSGTGTGGGSGPAQPPTDPNAGQGSAGQGAVGGAQVEPLTLPAGKVPAMTPEDMYNKMIAQRGFDEHIPVSQLDDVKNQLKQMESDLKTNPTPDLQRNYNRLLSRYNISTLDAAGGPAGAGYNTYAIVQVVGPDGKIIAVAEGKYTGGLHAEQIALQKLDAQLGGQPTEIARIDVVSDKQVCPDVCVKAFEEFSEKYKVGKVKSYVFRRPRADGSGLASEKTTARTATAKVSQGKVPVKEERTIVSRSAVDPSAPPVAGGGSGQSGAKSGAVASGGGSQADIHAPADNATPVARAKGAGDVADVHAPPVRPSVGGGGETPPRVIPGAKAGADPVAPRARVASEADKETETPRVGALAREGEAGESVMGGALKSGVKGAAVSIGTGLVLYFIQSAFRDMVLNDLAALPQPQPDKRSARAYFGDPKTASGMRTLDVLTTNLAQLSPDLEAEHAQISGSRFAQLMATALLPEKTNEQYEVKLRQLDSIQDALNAWEQQLLAIDANLDALLDMEGQLKQMAASARSVQQIFSTVGAGEELLKMGFSFDEYIDLLLTLDNLSRAVESALVNARKAKETVRKLIDETADFDYRVNKIWWDEVGGQFKKLLKDQEAAKRKAQERSMLKTKAQYGSLEGFEPLPMWNSDQLGMWYMYKTRESEILFELNELTKAGGDNKMESFSRKVELEEELSSVRKKMLAMRRGDPPPPSQEAIRW